MEVRSWLDGIRLFMAEVSVLVRRKIWLVILAVVALRALLESTNVINMYLFEGELPNVWEVGVSVLGGPFLSDTVIHVLGWMMIPAGFLLGVGEPYSELSASWNGMLLTRVSRRQRFWWWRMAAWFIVGLLYSLLAVVITAAVTYLLLPQGSVVLPTELHLGPLQAPARSVIIWVICSLVASVWWYTALCMLMSLLFPHAGVSTIGTLIGGYCLTALGLHRASLLPYLSPLIGANANLAVQGFLNSALFVQLGLATAAYGLGGLLLGYALFRRRMI